MAPIVVRKEVQEGPHSHTQVFKVVDIIGFYFYFSKVNFCDRILPRRPQAGL